MSVKPNDSDNHTKFELILAFVQRNILKNVQFYFAAFLILMVWQNLNFRDQADLLDEMREDNLKANSKVIGLTADGRVIGIEKTQVDSANLQVVIARAIRDSFIVGRRELTKNYSVSTFQSTEDLLNNSDRLKSAFVNYIYLGQPESLNDDDRKFQVQSAQYFTSYLKWLLMSLNENNLPHFISITDMKIIQFIPDKNRFSIRIQFPCQTESIGNDGKAISQYGINEVYADGVFDVAKGTTENPFGLKIIPKEMKVVEINSKNNSASTSSSNTGAF
jgi:hypothetical protein